MGKVFCGSIRVQQFTELQFSDLSPQDLRALVAIAIAAGTLYCFLGYRVLKFVIGLTGFLLAGSVAATFAGLLTEGHVFVMAIAGILGGIAGAIALFFLFKVGVFCLGLVGGAVIAHSVIGARPDDWISSVIIGAAVFGGLAALVFERAIITLATSVIGAWLLVNGVAFFVLGSSYVQARATPLAEGDLRLVLLCCWVGLSVLGAVTQFATYRPHNRGAT
jgi:hypothetical protein